MSVEKKRATDSCQNYDSGGHGRETLLYMFIETCLLNARKGRVEELFDEGGLNIMGKLNNRDKRES